MASPWDPYKVLGVSRAATREEVRRAFRRAALALHPDRNQDPDATEQFMTIRSAYEALTDPRLRAAVDRELDLVTQGNSQPAPVQSKPRERQSRAAARDEQLRRLHQLVSAGRAKEAQWYGQSLATSYPSDLRVQHFLAKLAVRQKDWQEACKRFGICIQLKPRDTEFLESYEFCEHRLMQVYVGPTGTAQALAYLLLAVSLSLVISGLLLARDQIDSTAVAILIVLFSLGFGGLFAGFGFRVLLRSPVYPFGGAKAWLDTGMSAAFFSSILALILYKLRFAGSSTTYHQYEGLQASCLLVSALSAALLTGNLVVAGVVAVFGSGALFSGFFAATAE